MIYVSELYGRLGNNLLQYNSLRQIASYLEEGYDFPQFRGDDIFNIGRFKGNFRDNTIVLNSNDILKMDKENLKELNKSHDICLNRVMGEMFFHFSQQNPNLFFNIKNPITLEPKNRTNISIHFRGGDFKAWDSLAILPTEYYINAINICLKEFPNPYFYLLTDDVSLESYKDTHKTLSNLKIEFSLGSNQIDDLLTMTDSDVIISSPSTFCICGGFIGKSKKIIHSKKWIDYRVSNNCKFWVDFRNGGNNYYQNWKEI